MLSIAVSVVRVALFSDVHANRAALEAVLAAIDAIDPDHVFVLGDLVGRGPEPQAVAKLIASREIRALRGNWDEWVAGLDGWDQRPKRRAWVEAARALMSKKARAFVADAPEKRRVIFEGVTVVLAHGSPRNPVELLTPDSSEEQLTGALAGVDADVVAVGHSHQPFVRRVGATLLVNVGTVGYPFNGDPRASFAVLSIEGETRAARAELFRVPYPLRANLRAMKRAVARGVVAEELSLRYRRALLGEGPEPFESAARSDRGAEALVKLLSKRTRAVFAGEALEDVVVDPSRVRQLRLATRKLREAIALVRPILDERDVERVMHPLTELGHQLGQRRTADVLAERASELGRSSGLDVEGLLRAIEVRRRRTTARIVERFTRARMIEDGLEVVALAMLPRNEETTVAQLARGLLTLRRARIEEVMPAIHGENAREAHHALRIQLRRLRHGSEVIGEAFPELPFESIAALAKSMHAALGKLNDAYELGRFLSSRRALRIMKAPALHRLELEAAARTHALYEDARARVREHVPELFGLLGQVEVEIGALCVA